MSYKVYLLKHPEAGAYVGKTKSNVKARILSHKSSTNTSTTPIAVAMGKFPFEEWELETLYERLTEEKAKEIEEYEIATRRPSLNVKIGDKWPEGYSHGGYKNKGNTASDETKEWFKSFHSNRPRKQNYDRTEIIRLYKEEGLTQAAVAKIIGCDQSYISLVVNNKYKINK